ncbi:MAG TPA: hypothetical protein VF961_03455, partial [Pyrinomonadaceae bacterium]
MSSLQSLILITPTNQSPLPLFANFWVGALTIAAAAFLVATVIDHFGVRRPLIYVTGTLLSLGILGPVVSWF